MELVIAGQYPEELARLKVAHTHHTAAQKGEGVKNSLQLGTEISPEPESLQ